MANFVEEYLKKHSGWEPQLSQLRELLLSSGLEETVKWGAPAYPERKELGRLRCFQEPPCGSIKGYF